MGYNRAMTKSEAKLRALRLRDQIGDLRYRYHVLNDPKVTDEVTDSLMRELRELESDFPELRDPNSPTIRVSGKPFDKFEKVRHAIPMLSLNDVFSRAELGAWEERIKKFLPGDNLDYFCELKLDGLAVSLIYENGKFIRGITRGDGEIGENITSNLKMIESIPLVLKSPYPEKIEVRGEAFMRKNVLKKLNERNKKEDKPLFANSRNAAAGSLRQLDPKLAKKRHLDFSPYEITQIKGDNWQKQIEKHSQKHKLLSKLSFIV